MVVVVVAVPRSASLPFYSARLKVLHVFDIMEDASYDFKAYVQEYPDGIRHTAFNKYRKLYNSFLLTEVDVEEARKWVKDNHTDMWFTKENLKTIASALTPQTKEVSKRARRSPVLHLAFVHVRYLLRLSRWYI